MKNKLTIYSNEELKAIQKIEFEILKEVKRVCELENIEFFLVGGTTLGAIRHNGFIPWDDDIDIGMTRNNYNKFISVANKHLSDNYFLQVPYEDNESPYLYSKLRVKDTIFMEYCNRNLKMHQGIYIDIFPHDDIPNNNSIIEKHCRKLKRLVRLHTLKNIPDVSQPPLNKYDKCKSIIRKFINTLFKLVPNKMIRKSIVKERTLYNNQGFDMIMDSNVPLKKGCFKKKDIFPLVEHQFENETFNIPKNYDLYLTQLYGDYMKFPPVNERYGHKPFKIKINSKD